MFLEVRRKPDGKVHSGLLSFAGRTIPCSLGRSGITVLKREGDGATPAGSYRILYGFYRNDRKTPFKSGLAMNPITKESGWCDEVQHPNYNAFVQLPFSKSHEVMMREDRLYDVCLVLDYNIAPKSRNLGSAIFFHLTRPDRGPTEGCVAIDPEYMTVLLPMLTEQSVMHINA